MRARVGAFRLRSLPILALLAGCGGSGADSESASIVSVYPEAINIVTDQKLEAVHLSVVLSDDTAHVCPAATGTAFPVMYAVKSYPRLWEPSTTWAVTFEPDPNLSMGEHVGSLQVILSSDATCQRLDGPSRLIPYHLSTVYGFAQPEPVTLRVDEKTTADELHGSARIDMAGGPQQVWTAQSHASWLVVDTPDGVTGSEVQFHVDPTTLASILKDGSTSAEIEISGGTEGMTSRRVLVRLQLALPIAKMAVPPDQPAGPPRRFRVRGSFTKEVLAHAPFVVEGVPDAVFTWLSDTDLIVELPPALPAGTYRVFPPNALGLSPGSAVIRLTAPVETARALLPGDGAGGHLLWDGARSALLVLEPPDTVYHEYSYTLRRHALRDGIWTTTSAGVNQLRRMGLSPDGTQLLATSEPDYWKSETRFYAFDPERLRVIGSYTSSSSFVPEPPSQAPLAVTFDGRAWSGTLNALLTYDLTNSYRMTMVSPSTWRGDDTPEQTIASRDGSRLLVSRPGAGAFLYHDATERLADDAFHVNPAGATTFDAISDDGDRVLSGVNVYDGDFALLGTLPGPAILSGDGRRAFTLEYRCDWRLGGPAPLVHVFDLTIPAGGGGALPELGTVDLLDHSTCAAGERACAPTSSLAVTPDGRVLFAQTVGGVLVVPIPPM